METKNLGIIASVIVGIAIIGAITLSTSTSSPADENAVSVDVVNTLLENNERVLVVDIRSADQYQAGHLYGASHDVFDEKTMEKRAKTIQSRIPEIASNYNFVLIDEDGIGAKLKAETMSEMGLQTFYLDGGMKSVNENVVSSSQTVITSTELMQKLEENEDIFLLDVRESDELLKSKIDGSVHIPLADIFAPDGLEEIPTDKPVVVICGSGNRATIASYALAQEGIDFQVLEGGINAWNAEFESNSGM